MGQFLRVNLGGENKKASRFDWRRYKNGGRTRDRTGDTGIFSPLLYLLSYPATAGSASLFVIAVSLIYYDLGKMQIFLMFFMTFSAD